MENNTYIPFLLSGSDKYIGSDRVDESTLRALMDSLGMSENASIADLYQFLPMPHVGAHINKVSELDGARINLHTHSFYEIIYVSEVSDIQYILGNDCYSLKKGDILMIAPGVQHKPIFPEKMSGPYTRYTIWMESEFIEQAAASFPEIRYAIDRCSENKRWILRNINGHFDYLNTRLEYIWNEWTEQRYACSPAAAYSLLSTLASISRTCHDHDTQSARAANDLSSRVYMYIGNHLADDLTLKAVAEAFHVSPSSLSHQFQKKMGVSFHRCVIERRLLEAKTLIIDGLPMSEVQTSCGFTDYPGFYRMFKKEYGISPRDFKKIYHR